MTHHNIENILAIYQLATPDEIAHGRRWYAEAKEACEIIASRYNLPLFAVVGVCSALSPRNRWTRNVRDCEAVCAAFVAGGSEQAEAVKACTFSANKRKAVAILEAQPSNFDGLQELLKGPKLCEFSGSILGEDTVTIDGHAFCIWEGSRATLANVPAIGVKLRRSIKADYREAAASLAGITAAQLQAITWVTWRRLHGITR